VTFEADQDLETCLLI